MKRRVTKAWIGAWMALATVSSPLVARATADLPNPNLRSNAFYIVDASDSKVLAARNERSAAPIASITKLMTALVVLDAHQPMDEIITITNARQKISAGASFGPIELRGNSRPIQKIILRTRARFLESEAQGRDATIVEVWGQR